MPIIAAEPHECDACQHGKQIQLPFPKGQAWRASQKLQLVHTDVCGSMSIPSLNGNRYFLLFIDDFSRMCWAYFLKAKSEVYEVFQQFKNYVENQTNLKIKTLRSDNGTKYSSSQFHMYCRDEEIQHQFTVTYTP